MSILDKALEFYQDRAIPVTDAERRVLAAAKTGAEAHIPGAPDPKSETNWTDDQTIRAAFLRHVCLHPDRYAVDPRGIQIEGARIWGELDLSSATLDRPLLMTKTRFENIPDFMGATLKMLVLRGGFAPGLFADRLQVDGSLHFKGSTFDGEVRLLGAAVKGNLDCTGASFANADDDALNACGLSVDGDVFLNVVTVDGAILLIGAAITGNLECHNATLSNAGGYALNANRLNVGGAVFLRTITARGETSLLGATITGNLSCRGARFTNAGGYALNANRLKVGGSMFLVSVTAEGETNLVGATIKSNLECPGASFTNAEGDAFNANRLNVGGSMFLSAITARGGTNLVGATITGNLSCRGARFTNPRERAFTAQRMTVLGRLFWDKFTTLPQGTVDFEDARVGDFLDDGTGWPEEGAGHLHLDGFRYENWRSEVTAQQLRDWLGRMPVYDADGSPVYYPQPYEQLIKVLRDSGHEYDARKIAIAKQDARHRYLCDQALRKFKFNLHRRAWLTFLKYTSGYGYHTWLPFVWMAASILVSAYVFKLADDHGYMHVAKERVYMDIEYDPTDLPDEYPPFNALTYSIDTLIPFVDLHQEAYWQPKTDDDWGKWLRLYFWIHIGWGWVIATLAAAGLAGIIKKD